MEVVPKNGISDRDFSSIVIDDLDFFKLDDLIGGNKCKACVPVGLTQILGGLSPGLLINGELLSNLLGCLLEYLLSRATSDKERIRPYEYKDVYLID